MTDRSPFSLTGEKDRFPTWLTLFVLLVLFGALLLSAMIGVAYRMVRT